MPIDFSFIENAAPKQEPAAQPAPAPIPSAYPECIVTQPDAETISINVKGVTFNMKLVEGGMVDENIELSDFYIGETVVTQELWMMVMGDNPSKDNRDMQLPVTNVTAALCNAFIRKLEKMTGIDFEIPTFSQWRYAHDGGNKSKKKYKYAGSDNVDEVAWITENSGGKLQPVAMLEPNELGLFDMDGNVFEYFIGQAIKEKGYCFNPISETKLHYAGYSACHFNVTTTKTGISIQIEEGRKINIENSENVDIIEKVISSLRKVVEMKRKHAQKDILLEKILSYYESFIGFRLSINVPVSASTMSVVLNDGATEQEAPNKTATDSPLYPILLRQQQWQEPRLLAEAEKRRRKAEEEEARKKLTYTLSVTAVKNPMVAMMALRALLGWKVAESRQKIANLPFDVMVTEDADKVKKVREQFADAGVDMAVKTVNGLGEVVENGLEIKEKEASIEKSKSSKNKKQVYKVVGD